MRLSRFIDSACQFLFSVETRHKDHFQVLLLDERNYSSWRTKGKVPTPTGEGEGGAWTPLNEDNWHLKSDLVRTCVYRAEQFHSDSLRVYSLGVDAVEVGLARYYLVIVNRNLCDTAHVVVNFTCRLDRLYILLTRLFWGSQ